MEQLQQRRYNLKDFNDNTYWQVAIIVESGGRDKVSQARAWYVTRTHPEQNKITMQGGKYCAIHCKHINCLSQFTCKFVYFCKKLWNSYFLINTEILKNINKMSANALFCGFAYSTQALTWSSGANQIFFWFAGSSSPIMVVISLWWWVSYRKDSLKHLFR